MRTVAFCEIEPFARRVLRKHWPEIPIYDDVRTLTADALRRDGIAVDLICGGFPCQDISCAGKGAGLAGERSGLWREYARLIGELRPRYVIVENVAALLGRGLDVVLGDLASLGFDAEWHCIPASAVGAPHRRDRVWIVAYADDVQRRQRARWANGQKVGDGHRQLSAAYAHGQGRFQPGRTFSEVRRWIGDRASSPYWNRHWQEKLSEIQGMDDGVSTRLDSLGCDALGNAVVPQIPELIGRAIMATDSL